MYRWQVHVTYALDDWEAVASWDSGAVQGCLTHSRYFRKALSFRFFSTSCHLGQCNHCILFASEAEYKREGRKVRT
jgi:hypothetical protein